MIKRGDVYWVNLEPVMGSEQGKVRPCVVVQNDLGNQHSPITIVAAITTKTNREFPFTVRISPGDGGLTEESLVLCHHLRSISIQERIKEKMGRFKPETMRRVDEALKTSLGLN